LETAITFTTGTPIGSASRREVTECHRIVLFEKHAESYGDRAFKGALIQVEGSLQTRDRTDRDGNKRYTTETAGRLVQVLGKREHPVTEPPASEEPPTPPEAEVPEDGIPF
jgi:single-strand DNA-binding protein